MRALGIGDDFADDPLRLRMRIEDGHIMTAQQKPRDPTAADHPAANAGDPAHRTGFASLRAARVSSGPRMPTPMPSRTWTARSTSCALVALTPRER